MASARITRRALAAATAAELAAGCSFPWQRSSQRGGREALPSPTPVRFGPLTLRVVLATEGVAALDGALREVVAAAAREAEATADLQDVPSFTGLGAVGGSGGAGDAAVAAEPMGEAIAQRLLAQVQAGVPPDALLVDGRAAQTVRFQAMGLLQDLSGLLRRAWRRFGPTPPVTEQQHAVAGNWFAVPHYQRLVGHWVREAPFRAAGFDPERALVDWDTLRRALSQVARPDGGFWGWGIGAADTADVDAWVWGAIHAWGGGLADLKGQRVGLATDETAAALEWLAATLAAEPWRAAVAPGAARWTDATKNARFAAGQAAYVYTERALAGPPDGLSGQTPGSGGQGSTGGPGGGGGASGPSSGATEMVDVADALYLSAPAGPARPAGANTRPRAIGGGAVWYLPRGAPPEAVERLIEAALDPARQRRLWQAGGGFALPAYRTGWDAAALAGWTGARGRDARRFYDELYGGGFASATGNAGPETAASQAIGQARLAAGMLRAIVAGRPAREVVDEAARLAVRLFRDYGLPGA